MRTTRRVPTAGGAGNEKRPLNPARADGADRVSGMKEPAWAKIALRPIQFLLATGWHAMRLHRIAYRLAKSGWPESAGVVSSISHIFLGVYIGPEAEIGQGLLLPHRGQGVLISTRAVIGDRCTIYHQVSIAHHEGGSPTIGNDVTIYPGAKVVGAVTIGDGAIVGTNAVVTEDVPAGATVAGVPARIVGSRASEALNR